jgi:hypothetical protein
VINLSGTITSGGVAQAAATARAGRGYLLVQNPSTGAESFWISFSGTATAASPTIEIVPGATFFWEGRTVPTEAISVIAPTTGTAFTILEA